MPTPHPHPLVTTTLHSLRWLTAVLLMAWLVISCGGGGGTPLSSAKSFTSFAVGSASASVVGSNITLTLPFGTDRSALVASFVSTGAVVKVGNTVQTSGSTANNFNSPVVYSVTAEDGSSQSYTVTITNALNPANSMSSYSVAGVSATISADQISVSLPFGTQLSSIVANFFSTGTQVKIGEITQLSGTTANNFEEPVVYTVIAENGNNRSYIVRVTSGYTFETNMLQKWLNNNTSHPAIGAQWNGGSTSIGWNEQFAITGKMPLIYGIEYYDNGPIETNTVARDLSAKYITDAFSQGGIVTLVDHMPNFVTGGDSWDRQGNTLTAILPGGSAHLAFVAYLDRLAAFMKSQSVNNIPVPILYRPFHEMNGNWFWWGDKNSGQNFVKLWQFCYNYLMRTKGVNNILWVWSPNIDAAASIQRYQSYWPGKAYVNVVGLDGYDNTSIPNISSDLFVNSFNSVSFLAKESGLPLALTEIGANPGAQSYSNFWDGNVMSALQNEFSGISYFLIWNGSYGPKIGTAAADGFKRLSESGLVIKLGDVLPSQIYGQYYKK